MMSDEYAPEPNIGSGGPPRQPQQPVQPQPAGGAADSGGSNLFSGRNLGIIGLVIALVAAFAIFGTGNEAEASELRLEPIGFAGENPFTASVGDGEEIEEPVEIPPATTPGAAVSVPAATTGLYGGTNENACDQEQLKSFLTQDSEKAQAWADVQGITVAEIPDFIDTLTPVLLRTDTSVLNHGFRSGAANQIDAVLQAGTAVLVDDKGQPVAKCACGNPLAPPRSLDPEAELTGEEWPSFDLTLIVVIQPAPDPILEFEIFDTETGTIRTVVPGNPSVAGGPPPTDTATPPAPTDTATPTDAPTEPATPAPTAVADPNDPSGVYDVTVDETCEFVDGSSPYNCDDRGGTYTAVVTVECTSETECTVTIERDLATVDPTTNVFDRQGLVLTSLETFEDVCFLDNAPIEGSDEVRYEFAPGGTGTATSRMQIGPGGQCTDAWVVSSTRTLVRRTS